MGTVSHNSAKPKSNQVSSAVVQDVWGFDVVVNNAFLGDIRKGAGNICQDSTGIIRIAFEGTILPAPFVAAAQIAGALELDAED